MIGAEAGEIAPIHTHCVPGGTQVLGMIFFAMQAHLNRIFPFR